MSAPDTQPAGSRLVVIAQGVLEVSAREPDVFMAEVPVERPLFASQPTEDPQIVALTQQLAAMQQFLTELAPSQVAVPQLQAQFARFADDVIPAIRNLEHNARIHALESRPPAVHPAVVRLAFHK